MLQKVEMLQKQKKKKKGWVGGWWRSEDCCRTPQSGKIYSSFLSLAIYDVFLTFHQNISTLCVSPLGFTVLSTTLPTAEERASCDNKEFGCCPDGKTAASNPEGSNCPCKSKDAVKSFIDHLSCVSFRANLSMCSIRYSLHLKRIDIFAGHFY